MRNGLGGSGLSWRTFANGRNWRTVGPKLAGKIHVYMGGEDTFYLDGPAHRLQALLDRLGAHASFTFIPNRTHFDLFQQPGDPMGLYPTA